MKTSHISIIGSGPAGYTAALYASRATLAPVLFEGFLSGPVGGQLMTTTEVENYPGFPEGISGPELMERFRKQAERFGTTFINADINQLDLTTHPYTIFDRNKNSYQSHAIIIATGAVAKRLDVPGTNEGEFWQKGVSACAVCDGALPLFRNRIVYVIGGGDTAMEEALFLTKYASEVRVVHRRDALRASKAMANRVLNHAKITILWNRILVEVLGDKVVTHVKLQNPHSGEEEILEGSGVFFAIGHTPNTAFLPEQVKVNQQGYIQVIPGTCKTTVEGVFSAGDVHDFRYRQAITAASSGCMAALEAEEWLGEKGCL